MKSNSALASGVARASRAARGGGEVRSEQRDDLLQGLALLRGELRLAVGEDPVGAEEGLLELRVLPDRQVRRRGRRRACDSASAACAGTDPRRSWPTPGWSPARPPPRDRGRPAAPCAIGSAHHEPALNRTGTRIRAATFLPPRTAASNFHCLTASSTGLSNPAFGDVSIVGSTTRPVSSTMKRTLTVPSIFFWRSSYGYWRRRLQDRPRLLVQLGDREGAALVRRLLPGGAARARRCGRPRRSRRAPGRSLPRRSRPRRGSGRPRARTRLIASSAGGRGRGVELRELLEVGNVLGLLDRPRPFRPPPPAAPPRPPASCPSRPSSSSSCVVDELDVLDLRLLRVLGVDFRKKIPPNRRIAAWMQRRRRR